MSFGNALRSEWTKLASLRGTWVYVVLLVGSIAGPMAAFSMAADVGATADWELLLLGTVIFHMIVIAFGGSTLAGEYNDQMNAHAFLTQDRRSLWLSARMTLTLVLIAVCWVIGVALAWLSVTVSPRVEFKGGNAAPDMLAGVLGFIVFGLIAMSLGVLTRSRVAAVAIPLVWILVVESMLEFAALAYAIFRPLWLVTPGARIQQVSTQLGGLMANPENPRTGFEAGMTQPMWFNIVVLVAWIVLAVGVAHWANAKRDVK